MFERQWLEQLCDAEDECEQCHTPNVALWGNYSSEPIKLMMCRQCWLDILEERKRSASKKR